MSGITERQGNCICVLSAKLGKPEPAGLERMSRMDASECIEELAKQLDNKGSFLAGNNLRLAPGAGNGTLSREAQTRLGLAAKLVHHQWALVMRKPQGEYREDFKRDVVDLFMLLGEVEQLVTAQLSAEA